MKNIKCYIADCPACIVGNTIYVEIVEGHPIREVYNHPPTTVDAEILTAKIEHLKSINYECFKS